MPVDGLLTQFALIVCASLVGSLIFTFIFVHVIKYSILHSASKAVGEETRVRIAEWLQKVVKDGITDALKDEKLKAIIIELMEFVKEKLIKEEEHKKG